MDVSMDVNMDASMDVNMDINMDVSMDVSMDVNMDINMDINMDVSMDVNMDVNMDYDKRPSFTASQSFFLQTKNVSQGLGEDHILTVAQKLGTYHGTVVAYKVINRINLLDAFPGCFHQASVESPLFSVFVRAGFQRLQEEWSGDATKTHLLEMLAPYEVNPPEFVVSGLLPQEPFATAMHGDLQPSNIFFKHTTDGQYTIKVIDWATARYSQGTCDLVYLLNIGVDADVRRRVTKSATDVYFNAFNAALTDLNANLSYPRDVFEDQLVKARQLLVVWSIMSVNLFSSTQHLRDRLTAILADILLDPTVPSPTLST
ncbi:putative Ecdysteroid kinase-containing protein 14 [Homarus americanus]|uniref:Putative Ecdysteroid kinase-containing protein 14 n=1 Tax=Homarus americanus TaxID=6706 RepID=A0A8J5K452_HOMAM|nr:putative Ecdysteroid kinase-containing protein 14 [Homarus americanus]